MLTQMVELSRSSDQFTFLNETSLIKLLCDKLPERLASSWVECLGKYKDNHGGKYPNFEEFANFVNTRSRYQNDPYFAGGRVQNPEVPQSKSVSRRNVNTHATDSHSAESVEGQLQNMSQAIITLSKEVKTHMG